MARPRPAAGLVVPVRLGRPRGRRGYTLIELLVVLFIVTVIAGIGISAFRSLSRTGELDATTALVRSLLRRARNSAREERWPAIVEIDTEASELRAVTRETVAMFRFESPLPDPAGATTPAPGGGDSSDGVIPEPAGPPVDDEGNTREEITGALNIRATVVNAVPVLGRLGTARLFGEPKSANANLEAIREAPASWVELENRPTLNPIEGIHLEAWILPGKLEAKLAQTAEDDLASRVPELAEPELPAREAPPRSYQVRRGEMPLFTILRKGKVYELLLNADYSIECSVSGVDREGTERTWIGRSRRDIVESGTWSQVAMSFDGRQVRLWINGIERSLIPLDKDMVLPARLAVTPAPLRISDPNPRRSFYGVIDEVRIAGIIRATTVKVPVNIAIVCDRTEVVFDARGALDPLTHAGVVEISLTDAPDFPEQIAGKSEGKREDRSRTVERGGDRAAAADAEAKRRERLARARRVLASTEPKFKRTVVIDRHGTLR